MDDQRRFYNACLILMSLDMDELVAAGVITAGNLDNGGSSFKRFIDDPLVFMAKIGDRQRAALWALIEERQPQPTQPPTAALVFIDSEAQEKQHDQVRSV